MRQQQNKRKIYGWLILLFFFVGASRSFATEDTIVAVVNDEIITQKELVDYLSAKYMQLTAEGKEEETIREMMTDYELHGIEHLIEEKLLVQAANKKGMEIRSVAVDERIKQVKKQFKTEQQFLDALAEDGLTLGDLRNKFTDQFKAKYIVETEVKSKIFVNPQEVTDYYQRHINDFMDPEKAELDSIFFSYKDGREQANQKAQTALDQLRSGKDFPEVSKEFSDAPSIGMITKGQLLPNLENSIFKLKEAETSPVIETDNGLYIFKIRKKIPVKVSSLEDVRNKIYSQLFDEKFQARLKSWIEDLRKNAYIELKK